MYILNPFVNFYFYPKFAWGTLQGSINNKTYNFLYSAYAYDFFCITKHFTCSKVDYCCPSYFLISFIFLTQPWGVPQVNFCKKKRLMKVFKTYSVRLSFLRWFQIYYSFRVELQLLWWKSQFSDLRLYVYRFVYVIFGKFKRLLAENNHLYHQFQSILDWFRANSMPVPDQFRPIPNQFWPIPIPTNSNQFRPILRIGIGQNWNWCIPSQK